MNVQSQPSLLVEQKRIEEILQNKRKKEYWEEKKKAHEETEKSLKHYAGKLQEQIMLPIGKRGLIQGRIVNTNQIFVSLGDGWFLKVCSIEAQKICRRRIVECNEMLDKLEKEKKLFEGWTILSEKQEIFETDSTKEIIEPYDETEEESWRLKHAEKIKEHRKKLAEVQKQLEENRDKEKITTEDLWKHLDLLELQEEFEDELNRLDGNSTESDNESSSILDSDDDSIDNDTESVQNDILVAENTLANSKTSIIDFNNDSKQKGTVKLIKDEKSNSNFDNVKIERPMKKVTFHNSTEVNRKTNENINDSIQPMISVTVGEIKERIVAPTINQSSSQQPKPLSKFKLSKRSNQTS